MTHTSMGGARAPRSGRNTALLALAGAGLLLAITGCGPKRMDMAAVIGSDTLTMEQYREALVTQFKGESEAAGQTPEKRREVLDRVVHERLVALVAADEGWYRRPEYVQQKLDYENEYMEREIYDEKVARPILTDSLLMDTWNRQGTEVKAAHMLFLWAPDSAAVRQKALDALAEINGGLSFPEAVTKYTEERGGRERAGELGWFTWGMMDPAFQEACWALKPQEISGPVESSFGVHLIRLEDRRAVEVRPSFEESRKDLEQAARNSQRNRMIARGMAYLDSLHREYGLVIPAGTAADLHRDLGALVAPEKNFLTLVKELGPDWSTRPLVRWVEGEATVVTLQDYLGKRYHTFTPETGEAELERILKDMMLPKLLAKKGRELGLDRKPDVVRQVTKRLDRAIQVEYEQVTFKNPSAAPEKEIAARFEAQPDSFMHPPMVRVQEILVEDGDLATMLANRARSGQETFDSLAETYTTRPGKKPERGNLEPFAEGRYDMMGEIAFTMEVGQISDPIPLGNKFSVIKLLEKLPTKPMRLDEASTKIRYTIEREKKAALEAAWTEKARKAHPTIINELAPEQVFPPAPTAPQP